MISIGQKRMIRESLLWASLFENTLVKEDAELDSDPNSDIDSGIDADVEIDYGTDSDDDPEPESAPESGSTIDSSQVSTDVAYTGAPGNLLVSPLSVIYAMSMVTNGRLLYRGANLRDQ